MLAHFMVMVPAAAAQQDQMELVLRAGIPVLVVLPIVEKGGMATPGLAVPGRRLMRGMVRQEQNTVHMDREEEVVGVVAHQEMGAPMVLVVVVVLLQLVVPEVAAHQGLSSLPIRRSWPIRSPSMRTAGRSRGPARALVRSM